MPFFKNLRRRSKATFTLTPSAASLNPNDDVFPDKLSSNLDSPTASLHSSPISFFKSNSIDLPSPHLPILPKLKTNGYATQVAPPQRPVPIGSPSTPRGSTTNGSLLSPTNSGRGPAPAPLYAPRVFSISDNSWVHQKILLIYGQIGDARQHSMDGNLTVYHPQDSFPPTTWPVYESHFKALLAIVLGSDSDGHFDAVPERSFTGEQMYRNKFGRRCFRFEEEWQAGTLSLRDSKSDQMRNEARIHIIRCDRTVDELRKLGVVQQDGTTSDTGELFNVVLEAVKRYFGPQESQTQYVSALLLDTHWDKGTQTITGHAAAGSVEDHIKLALFGSYALQNYPSAMEEVVAAFTDCTRTDINFVANYGNKCGSNWEAANSGIGGHLRVIGRLFGCHDQDSGIMCDDSVPLNRSFTIREPYSTRTKAQGLRLCLEEDECTWHRLDTLRFRFHPCFRLPRDSPLCSDDSIQVWSVDNGKVLVTSAAGIAFIEIYVDYDDLCRSYIEYVDGDSGNNGIPKQIDFTEGEIRQHITENFKKIRKIKLVIYSGGLSTHTVDDVSKLNSKYSTAKLPNGQVGYRGNKLGQSRSPNGLPEQLFLECAFIQSKLLISVKVYHNGLIYGLEFCYEDSTSQVFGNRDPQATCSEFVFGRSTISNPGFSSCFFSNANLYLIYELDTRRGEILMGFYVKTSQEIDGIGIITNLSRRSAVFGNSNARAG
ncbi:conserved hypothetical protein [Histoplasma mississippiense (nom. inval.)]|uniref:conserved hypothetical protein n=1 Tax=Ajellomyces capsulatus (strain NAm1 / WU24) TaxID=2059318 RepID=UPI000157C887|nr:conserved hypothetical protein [Histoplasma mississippiense (nom. inval.)]EDN09410.1 conserved hypothetical protein [Histoplasma mississippiense (nom. inval.)]